MSELFSRFKAKLKEIYHETPLPNLVKKLKPRDPADGPELPETPDKPHPLEEFDWPDDFRDIQLEKTNRVYHIKLKDIAPHQWMLVGTKLRNMAIEDPEYGHDYEGEPLPGEPLPPPPEPTEYLKNLKAPLISMHLRNLSWVELEEVGEVFYDLGWTHRKEYDIDDYDNLPCTDWCDEFPTTDEEDVEEELFDPAKRIHEEQTEVKRITNSDVLPGIAPVPWKDDAEAWLENPNPDLPPWTDDPPYEDQVVPRKFNVPMQRLDE